MTVTIPSDTLRCTGPKTTGVDEEAALVKALIAGDRGAWEEFVRQQGDVLYSFLRIAFPEEDVEDRLRGLLERLRAEAALWLGGFDGRARLGTHLRLRLCEVYAGEVLHLLDRDAERGWLVFERLFKRDIERSIDRILGCAGRSRAIEDGYTRSDLYQEICCRLAERKFDRLRAFRRQGSFAPFVRHVVRNLCIDHLRRILGRKRPGTDGAAAPGSSSPETPVDGGRPSRAQPEPWKQSLDAESVPLADRAPSPEQLLIDVEEQAAHDRACNAVRVAVAQLPAEVRLYLRLRFDSDPPLPPREIARLMGRSVEEVYRLREKAMNGLRGRLEQENGPRVRQEESRRR